MPVHMLWELHVAVCASAHGVLVYSSAASRLPQTTRRHRTPVHADREAPAAVVEYVLTYVRPV